MTFRCTNVANSSDLTLNKTYTNAEVTELLQLLLSPYVPPKNLVVTRSNTNNFLFGTTNSVYPRAKVTKGSEDLTTYTFNGTQGTFESGNANASVGEDASIKGVAESIKDNTTWKVVISDGRTTLEKSTSSQFYWPYYVGLITSEPQNLTVADLGTGCLTTEKTITHTATVSKTTNQYFWMAIPRFVTPTACKGGKNSGSLTNSYDLVKVVNNLEVTLGGTKYLYNVWTPTAEAPVVAGTTACFQYTLNQDLKLGTNRPTA